MGANLSKALGERLSECSRIHFAKLWCLAAFFFALLYRVSVVCGWCILGCRQAVWQQGNETVDAGS